MFEQSFDVYVKARERAVWDQQRNYPFDRLMVKKFSNLFRDDGEIGPDDLSRRMLPGFFVALGMMLGTEVVEKYQQKIRTIVDKVKAGGKSVFDWDDVYADEVAETVSLDAEVGIAGYFEDFDKRAEWFIDLINNHLTSPEPSIGAAAGQVPPGLRGVAVTSTRIGDVRGDEGFWRAYPPYARLGLRFEELADPEHFADDPALAWGFYGHRLHLYRDTVPHPGFAVLRRWAGRVPSNVFTSNVDGQFQRAGFAPDDVAEVHGSIHHLQCLRLCGHGVWPADGVVDEATLDALGGGTRPRRGAGSGGVV